MERPYGRLHRSCGVQPRTDQQKPHRIALGLGERCLNWLCFHAIRDKDDSNAEIPVSEMASRLSNALRIPPVATRTKQNEAALGIAPNCVYLYIGTGEVAFSKLGLCLPLTAVSSGKASPFDTGGLVAHHEPVKSWGKGDIQSYLNAYSWDISDLPPELAKYPGSSASKYLRQRGPDKSGPDEIWGARGSRIGDIWAQSNGLRSWLWEIRIPGDYSVQSSLKHWTGTGDLYNHVKNLAEEDGPMQDWAIEMLSKWVPGGYTILLRKMISYQEGS